jgi:hypothetical protein
MTNPIGPLPSPPEEFTRVWGDQLVDRLDQIHSILGRVANTGYQISNLTKDRVLDCNLASSSHTITDATVGSVTGAALSTSNTYTDSAVNTEINVVVGNVKTAVNAAIATNNTNTEVALNALGADILELADVIGTLIQDMKERGWLGG